MEHEYSNMCLDIIKIICDEYNLSLEDVKKKLKGKLALTFELDAKKLNYRFVHRAPPREKSDESTCVAMMFDFKVKTTRRCSQQRCSHESCSLFCSTHLRMHYTGRLAYGVADGHEAEYDEFCKQATSQNETTMPVLRKQVVRKVK